ncbi:meiosis-specific with OB domain-containing protein [Copidosoma floridanum]|uniref:meiosis-specific with OB domain-containing protein n=1 Tax=Copidosoma floridanum TaxID=29053 RepID=UPI000C6F919D|nr:meiosis-specific with OB domain-containing protein [Copidosoma floridanum]
MANVSRQPICTLEPKMQNTIVIGVIIRSQNSKIIELARDRFNAGTRAVWNFTLRDSFNDFINATVWGTVEYVNKLFTTFTIGSVVEVINAKVTERKINDPNEVYVPSVTSPFTLTLNQHSSLIQMHNSPNTARYLKFLNMPTKDPGGATNLNHILNNSETLKNEYVDVLVAVTFVSQTREIVTRMGEMTKIREFEVGDDTTDQTVSLTLWESEWIRLADKWEPKQTILFLADVQVVFNEKAKKSILTIVRKTIITENPMLKETEELRFQFQRKPDIRSTSLYAVPNPNSITKQMMIIEITSRLNNASVLPSNDRMQLLVVVRAMVDDMNLDCDDPTLISYRCAKCKRLVSDEKESCMNLECPFGSGIKSPINITSINVLVNLKDDTGYLVGCRLRDAAAEEAFSCSADIMRSEFKIVSSTYTT